MFFFLSHLSDPVHKIDRIDKIIEFESALDLIFLQFPFRDLFHAILELALFDQVSHNGTTSITRKSFCNGKSSAYKSSILRRFLTESKNSTAQWRACFDTRDQSRSTSRTAASASVADRMKLNPFSAGRYRSAPVSSVTTGRPNARKAAARSLIQPVRHATSTPLIAVNSASALAR